jgi:hypothetical protein
MKRRISPEPVTDLPTDACRLCAADVIHCHEVSIEHADGSTACTDPWCNLPHHLHEWQLACDAFAPPCPCAGDEHGLEVVLPQAA